MKNSLLQQQENTLNVLQKKFKFKDLLKSLFKKQTIFLFQMRREVLMFTIKISKKRVSTTHLSCQKS
jgi:hypothetical protein